MTGVHTCSSVRAQFSSLHLCCIQSFLELNSEAGSPESEEAPEITSYPQGGLGPGGATLLKVEDEKLKEDDLYELLHDMSVPQG